MTETITNLLLAEREKLNRAINILQPVARRGRPPKINALTVPVRSLTNSAVVLGRREFTPEQRAEQSRRMKLVWAQKRNAKKR